jgi:integrase/recombinase XerD
MTDEYEQCGDGKTGLGELFRVAPAQLVLSAVQSPPPAIVTAGPMALTAWDDFFAATIRNRHTRAAYAHAVCRFFKWLAPTGIEIARITPGTVGRYFADHTGSIPTRKLHLAALRAFFDLLVNRHICLLNPAASVRGERYQVLEGKTPEIAVAQARFLLNSIRVETKNTRDGAETPVPLLIGLRDRAVIATLIYTAARAGAVAKLKVRHLIHDGTQWTLRFEEKGGKSREIPVRHDLEQFLLAYLRAAGIAADRDAPLFRSADRRTGLLTPRSMTAIDVLRLVKRRLKDAGLPQHYSPHSFRVTTVTDLLSQGVPLEDVQHLAGHADPRTTRLYDRRQKRVTRNVVERISI